MRPVTPEVAGSSPVAPAPREARCGGHRSVTGESTNTEPPPRRLTYARAGSGNPGFGEPCAGELSAAAGRVLRGEAYPPSPLQRTGGAAPASFWAALRSVGARVGGARRLREVSDPPALAHKATVARLRQLRFRRLVPWTSNGHGLGSGLGMEPQPSPPSAEPGVGGESGAGDPLRSRTSRRRAKEIHGSLDVYCWLGRRRIGD